MFKYTLNLVKKKPTLNCDVYFIYSFSTKHPTASTPMNPRVPVLIKPALSGISEGTTLSGIEPVVASISATPPST